MPSSSRRWLSALLLLTAGCLPSLEAKRVPLAYEGPVPQQHQNGINVGVRQVQDLREDRSLDTKVTDVRLAVASAIKRELGARPGVRSVTLLPPDGEVGTSDSDLVISASLLVLGSAIPYRVGALAGMLTEHLVLGTNGFFVGMTDTQSKGFAVLEVTIAGRDGTIVTKRVLVGEAGHDIPRAYMDKPQTASRVAGMALKRALDGLPALVDEPIREAHRK